jgi:hypothetical protein
LTLARWHKVAERLSREFTDSVGSSRTCLSQTVVSAYLGDEQEQFLQQQTLNALENLQRAFRIQDTLAKIRQTVGDANVHEGISLKLAEFDKLNRRIKVLSELIESQSAEMVTPAQLRNLPRDYVADGASYDSRRPKIRVRMLDLPALDSLQAQLDASRVRAYALADEIADLNRAKVSVALEAEMASIAGL